MVFVDGYPEIDRQNADSYYQLLSDGKTQLLKRYFKTITENHKIITEKVDGAYSNGALYYVFKDNKIVHLKKNKDGILKLMSDKSSQIDDFLSQNNVDFKSEYDLKKLFDYYNKL